MTTFWILWSPEGDTPPRVRFGTEEGAKASAAKMAADHYPSTFYVMKAVAGVKAVQRVRWDKP